MSPWKAESGIAYDLCLFDTNILSEAIKNTQGEGRRLLATVCDRSYAPCVCFHTIIELRRRADLFRSFLELFSVVPWFMLKPWGLVELDEASGEPVSPLLHAFSSLGRDQSYDARNFISEMERDPDLMRLEAAWRREETFGIDVLKQLAANFNHSDREANFGDAENFIRYAGKRIIRKPSADLEKRPGARTGVDPLSWTVSGFMPRPSVDVSSRRPLEIHNRAQNGAGADYTSPR